MDFLTRIVNFGKIALREPLKAITKHGQQFSVTSAAAFMSAAFSMQHGVLPVWVAVPLAIGFEWTYLHGLSTADKTLKSVWSSALNWSAMLTSIVYGVLYVLGHYEVIGNKPDWQAALLLAIAHVIPMAILSFCSANLRREHRQAILEQEEKARREQEESEREHRDFLKNREREWIESKQQLQLQLEQAKVAEDIRAMRRQRVVSAKVSSDVSSVDISVDSSKVMFEASETRMDSVREQLRKQIVSTILEDRKTHKKTNKVVLARSLKISRSYLYMLIDEAQRNGELDESDE